MLIFGDNINKCFFLKEDYQLTKVEDFAKEEVNRIAKNSSYVGKKAHFNFTLSEDKSCILIKAEGLYAYIPTNLNEREVRHILEATWARLEKQWEEEAK